MSGGAGAGRTGRGSPLSTIARKFHLANTPDDARGPQTCPGRFTSLSGRGTVAQRSLPDLLNRLEVGPSRPELIRLLSQDIGLEDQADRLL